MDQPDLLDAAVVRAWGRAAVDALALARTELDGVNVFPVADGDTGTNMYLTVREAVLAIHDVPAGASGARLLRAGARAALLGARGNSGVILSEWLRGFAVAVSRRDPLGMVLDVAAQSARQAVAHPAPGTILTAADSAAAAARHAEAGGMVGPAGAPARLTVLDAARQGAREAALRSVGALAPLRAAGVLDAGACGLVLILGALAEAQRHAGEPAMSDAAGTMSPVLLDLDLRGHRPSADDVPPDVSGLEPASDPVDEVELMFVLHRPGDAAGFRPGAVADALRADLDEVGNSVVVVGGGDDAGGGESLWQAHVHTPDFPSALEVTRRWARRGTVSHVHVRHLAVPPADWAVIAVTSAPALAAELASGGAHVLLDLDRTPSADDLAQAVLGAGTPHVLVLAPLTTLGARNLDDSVRALVARGALTDETATVPDVRCVPAGDDVALVTAVAALAGAVDGAHAVGTAPDASRVVTDALDRLRVAGASVDEASEALAGLIAGSSDDGVGIVALLPDAQVPETVVTALVDQAVALAPGADVVVLPTGRPAARVGIGVEPVETTSEQLAGDAW